MSPRSRTLLLEGPCSAGTALQRVAPEDPSAIAEGRLFVERQRIHDAGEALQAHQVVTWYATRGTPTPPETVMELVLESREGVVAASKPAAWSSEPDRTGRGTSLRERLAETLHEREIHVATRLDVGVSGLLLLATDARSRRHLASVVGSEQCHRSYVAVVSGCLPDRGTWQGAVETATPARASRNAITHFECIERVALAQRGTLRGGSPGESVSLLILRPETGHRHQLRIHCSRAKSPILGDRRYGGPHQFVDNEGRVTLLSRLLLHALATTLTLPSGKVFQPRCPVPEDFRSLWRALGGTDRQIDGIGT
jgi:23S rRNA-/tRNA-specific pseudouridylate synthase